MTDAEALGIVERIREMLNGNEGEYDARELVPSLYLIHDYDTQGNRLVGTYPCGSVRLTDTPASLYRALFLFRPERASFKDMYKNAFLTLVSPDYHLVATLEFFKYEMAIYFEASREYVSGTSQSPIISGLPGSDNGIQYNGEYPEAWFGLLRELLTRKWMVYGGNDFEV